MSPTDLTTKLAAHPRTLGVLFTFCVLLAQVAPVAASGNCGVITGP